jgi:hypothetical protein
MTATESAGNPGGGTPPAKGMSGGAKVLIGCAIAFVVVAGAGAVAVGGGAWFLGKKAQEFTGSAERHAEATATLEQLHSRYPFEPPADRAVTARQADAFLRVSDDAWERARPAWEELERRSERANDRGRAGLGDMMAGLSGIHEVTMALAESLEAQKMSPREYVWTGLALQHAYRYLDDPEAGEHIPSANLELARRHRDRIAQITEEDDGGRNAVFAFATIYGLSGMEHGDWFRSWDTER